jgi:hypothetical protein
MDKKTYNVFISYSHKDSEVADVLLRELSKQGLDVWSDRNIEPGADWNEEITHALKEADVYLLLVTPNSIASQWANFEMGVALSRQEKSHVIPVLLKNVMIPPHLSSLQYVDGRNVDTSKLSETITKIIKSKESE